MSEWESSLLYGDESMEALRNDPVENLALEIKGSFPVSFVKHYGQATARLLRVCRIHGPYQAAALLTTEISNAGTDQPTTPSPKQLLHEHLIRYLGGNNCSLIDCLSQEQDPVKCLDHAYRMLHFLVRMVTTMKEGDLKSDANPS
jgi:hypothetical protein